MHAPHTHRVPSRAPGPSGGGLANGRTARNAGMTRAHTCPRTWAPVHVRMRCTWRQQIEHRPASARPLHPHLTSAPTGLLAARPQITLPQPPQSFVDAGLTSDTPGRIGVWNLMGPKSNVFVLGNQYGSMGAREKERRANRCAGSVPPLRVALAFVRVPRARACVRACAWGSKVHVRARVCVHVYIGFDAFMCMAGVWRAWCWGGVVCYWHVYGKRRGGSQAQTCMGVPSRGGAMRGWHALPSSMEGFYEHTKPTLTQL